MEDYEVYNALDKEILIEIIQSYKETIRNLQDSVSNLISCIGNTCRCDVSHVNEVNGKYICTICNKPIIK